MRWDEDESDTNPKASSQRERLSVRERTVNVFNSAREHGRDFVINHRWQDAAILLLYAALTGFVIVAFTLLAEAGTHFFRWMVQWGEYGRYMPLVWTPLLTVGIVWCTQKYAPGAAGSGIPQVIQHLEETKPTELRASLVSFRLSVQKVLLVSSGFLAGLSLGREGPAVQVGAGIMSHAGRWLSPRAGIDRHDLIVAGAAAGIAASFNTPLGGIAFALEQLTKRRHIAHTSLIISCIVLAGLVSISIFGASTYFGTISVQSFNSKLLLPGVLVVLASGVLGGLFSKVLVASLKGTLHLGAAQIRQRQPLVFAGCCGLVVGVLGILSAGSATGAGYWATRGLLEGVNEVPDFYTIYKLLATWITTWSGVPGGVFAPSLAIGAGIGRDISALLQINPESAIPLIALGMVGFLSATTQGPVTAFIIVMEMIAGQSMVISLMLASLLASGVSRLITPPMYIEIAALFQLPKEKI